MNLMRLSFICLLLCLAAFAFARPAPHNAPNVSLYVYQRIFPINKQPSISIRYYNMRSVKVSLYRARVEDIIPNAAVLENSYDEKNPQSAANRLKAMTLNNPVRTQVFTPKKFYPDYSFSQEAKFAPLPEGVYIVEAGGWGITKRTWFAVSSQALLVKRSPDVVKAWLVNSTSGAPVSGARLNLYNEKGLVQTAQTGKDGLASFTMTDKTKGLLWIASQERSPAFARASTPEEEKPFRVFLQTDRPIYRPGQLVQFRGTVRAVNRGELSLPKAQAVRVQIKTRGDTIVSDDRLPLNKLGTFSGQFQLAPEPPLGYYSVEISIGEFRDYFSFSVESYRKPEFSANVSLPAEHVPNGSTIPVTISAAYYAGSPVSGAKVRYSVRFHHYGEEVPAQILNAVGLGSLSSLSIEDSFSGDGTLDSEGKFQLSLPTRTLPYSRTLHVSATVTDLANRDQTASAGMRITSANYTLSMEPERGAYLPGQKVDVIVTARNLEGKPVSTRLTVKMIDYLTDREGRGYTKETKQEIRTNAEGRGTASFTVTHPGWYELEAWGVDDTNNAVYASSGINVEEKLPKPQWPILDTYPLDKLFAPGDVARLHVRTTLVGGKYLLTVEGERLYRIEVGTFTAKEFAINIPIKPEYLNGVVVSLSSVKDGRWHRTYDSILVPANKQKLLITLTPEKDTYQPGDTANFNVLVKDASGKGVSAEVGLGVVDSSIYAIREDNTPNPFNVFWTTQAQRVTDDFSLAGTYPGGAYQNVPTPKPPARPEKPNNDDGGIRVRRNFADTAYWQPSLLTDDSGKGSFTFTIPDNLTSWRTTARAITSASSAGEGRNEVKVNMPLMVRMALPRFYVQHDEATAGAIIQNYTDQERTVKVTLTAEGVQIDGPVEQTVTIPASGIKRLNWKVRVTGEGMGARARFLVSADGGEGARDATESTLPILPDGVRRVDAQAGMTDSSADVTVKLPTSAVMGSGKMEISVSPSLAGPIFEALDFLVEYPYGCAEQTMSQLLPNVIVARALRDLKVDRPEPKMLDRYVNFGVQKLLRYQHADGGWNWWEFDESESAITAYIVYGLALARDAGYPRAEGPLPRGVDYLINNVSYGSPAEMAYQLWALIVSGQWDGDIAKIVKERADKLIAYEAKMDIFSRASLILALEGMSKHKDMGKYHADAVKIAGELEAIAIKTGDSAHWSAGASRNVCGSWMNSDVEVTSQVMMALLAVKPKSELLTPAVRWMMAARRDKGWIAGKDTASAVMALTEYLRQTKELSPNYTLSVRVNGREMKNVAFGEKDVFNNPTTISIPASELKPGDNQVQLVKTGGGNLYWNARISYVLPAEQASPSTSGLRLVRKYQVMAEDPVEAGIQHPGALIKVTTTLIADQNYQYMLLEEPIPAGCEIASSYHDDYYFYRNMPFNRSEVWDDRILYYFNNVRKGEQTISYWLRTESPGKYRIRPTTAWLIYQPEQRGEGKFVRLNVAEE